MEHSAQVSVEATMLNSTKSSHLQEEEMSEEREFFTTLQLEVSFLSIILTEGKTLSSLSMIFFLMESQNQIHQ